MSNVEDINKNKNHYSVLAMCVNQKFEGKLLVDLCGYRWIGTVVAGTSLFKLQCPRCGEQDSFASFLPDEYMEEFKK